MSQTDKRFNRLENGGPNSTVSAVEVPRASIETVRGGSWLGTRWAVPLAAVVIIVATLAAYSDSFHGVFVFDDEGSIVNNATVRHLWPIWKSLSPPGNGETVTGRPLLNLTFALNYALGELDLLGYHAVNLAIHILAALTLFGILRRTFTILDGRWTGEGGKQDLGEADHQFPSTVHRPSSTFLPLAIALLWALHPLQTESVTYIVQRSESLCGLFYLLTLYCLIRGATSPAGASAATAIPPSAFRLPPSAFLWYFAAVLACLLGMATKEVMVTAPLVVLLYDRAFLAGSFAQAWRRRRGLYLGLAATWVLLAALLIGTRGRADSVGFHSGITAGQYALTQCMAIARYVRLSFWPSELCFDYGVPLAKTAAEIVPGALLLLILASATLWALLRQPGPGFLGAFFLATLAPTSSFVPIGTQTIAEHRFYLPLAAVIAAVIVKGDLLLGEVLRRLKMPRPRRAFLRWSIPLALIASSAVALSARTWLRNEDYRTGVSIWEDTVRQCPRNARAQFNLGSALDGLGRVDEAVARYQEALLIKPDYAEAENNLGVALAGRGQFAAAAAHCRRAVEIKPNYAQAHNNLGNVLIVREQADQAIAHYSRAVEIDPEFSEAYSNLGNAEFHRGHFDAAIADYRRVLQIGRGDAVAHNDLANVLAGRGNADEAIMHYGKALEIRPDYEVARRNLALVLSWRERTRKDLAERRNALRLRPNDAALLNDTAWMLATNPNESVRNGTEAVELAQRALRLSGDRDPAVLDTLAAAYAEAGRFPDALDAAQKALALAHGQRKGGLAEKIVSRIALYQGGRPYRDSP